MTDDDESAFESVSDPGSDAEDDATSQVSSNNDTLIGNMSLSDPAVSLNNDINNLNLSEEEECIIADSTVNTKKCKKTKNGVEARFFNTIGKYGMPELKQLLEQHLHLIQCL